MRSGRFEKGMADNMRSLNASISFDKRFYREDIEASKAWARGLSGLGFLSEDELGQICSGLDLVAGEIESGSFTFSEELEDIHMNVEARLVELVGDVGGRGIGGCNLSAARPEDGVPIAVRQDLLGGILRLIGIGMAVCVSLGCAVFGDENPFGKVFVGSFEVQDFAALTRDFWRDGRCVVVVVNHQAFDSPRRIPLGLLVVANQVVGCDLAERSQSL